ncbi:MAG: hypothetical protein GWP27_05190 [Bacteroidetes bacterium]|nr:hypothetical protein [Bacteroidota bacterium]
MRLLLSIILLFASGQVLFGQSETWKKERVLKHQSDLAVIDQLSNIYVVHQSELIKLNDEGDELARYSNKLFGQDLHLDVSNPMKILLFSADQMQLVFLDSRLSEIQRNVDLFQEGFEQISLAATSHSNGFWLFDPVNFRLIRYDQELKRSHESLNLAQIIQEEFHPTDMKEYMNRLYLVDSKIGVVVFDIYGNYVKRIPIQGIMKLRFADGRLVYRSTGGWEVFNLASSEIEQMKLNIEEVEDFDINRNSFLAKMGDQLFIFKPHR